MYEEIIEQKIKEKIRDQKKAEEVLSLHRELQNAYQKASSEGIKSVLRDKINRLERDFSENIKTLKDLV